jgi:uncharacterized membrane-anchored protein YitT (DUF2179 family)
MAKKERVLKRVVFILIGSLLSALAINMFIIPHNLISGGVGGIAIIIQYLTGLPSGIFILLLNIPIFIIGLKEVDRDFIIFSLIGMLSLSGFLILTRDISNSFKIEDALLSAIYGGVVSGIGLGMAFRNRGSQGGTDILAVVLKRRLGINIATLSLSMNMVVVAIGACISNIETALYTLVSMYITSQVMDRVIEGLERKKMLFIVTEKEKEVSDGIMQEIGRGVTFFYGEGAYTGDSKKVLYCIITSRQLTKTMKIVEDIDPASFISIVDTAEVQGRGFKKAAL